MVFAYPYGLSVPEPVSGDEIAWHLIRLGMDCGLDGPTIFAWLLKFNGFPLWPDRESLRVYMEDAGL